MLNHDNEQANARRRLVYAHNRDQNNKKQRLLYRAARQLVDMSSSFSLVQPLDTPSLPSPMLNLSNTPLYDALQRFRKKMDQLANIHVCSIYNECYTGITMRKFLAAYECSRCILERKGHHFSLENNMNSSI